MASTPLCFFILSLLVFHTPSLVAKEPLAELEKKSGGRLGVAVLDTESGKTMEYRANERFAMCSTFKFLLVSAVLSKVDSKEEKLSRLVPYTSKDILNYAPITRKHLKEGAMSIEDLCDAAIRYSDNTAANLLLGSLGGPQSVTAYVRSLGDSLTRLDRIEPFLNDYKSDDERDTTTPKEMLNNLQKLLLTDELSSESRSKLKEWLVANTTGANRLRAGLPQNWKVGDKTGSGNSDTTDIAIIWPPNHKPLLITVYFNNSELSMVAREKTLAEVANIVVKEIFEDGSFCACSQFYS
jgi:beta-lactamase class A